MLLSTLLVLASATLSVASAAPYASVAATSRDIEPSPKFLLSLSGDDMEDNDEVAVDPTESLPDDDASEDDDYMQRDLRSKNYLRFGRSSGGAAAKSGTVKEGSAARFSRGGEPDDNFIRLGRSTSFLRLGRNNADEAKVPVTRAANSNFIRLGRARVDPNNFIRFGRGSHDFIRFGRDGNEELVDIASLENNATLARLARDSHFIRLGRVPNSNFMRLGRSDNFLRFGKGDNYLRFGRGSTDNFIRFGRGKSDALFGRGKLTDRNFIRLGRSSSHVPEGGHLMADSVKPATKYIRFGQTIPGVDEMDDHVARFGRDVEHVDEKRQAKSHRRKRSLRPDDEYLRYEESEEKPISADLPYQYYSPLVGVPFAPELTVLPPFYTKRTSGTGNGNFIRFG